MQRKQTQWLVQFVGWLQKVKSYLFHFSFLFLFFFKGLRNKIYSTKSDVYSYGCVLIELITRDVPFGHITQAFDVAMAVVKDGATPPIPANTPPPLVDLIKTCFQDAQHRPSFQEINEYLERAAP